MSNLIQFPNNGPSGTVSPEYSSRLENIREWFGVEADKHDVIVKPLGDFYEPNFYPNGVMQLGKTGREHFQDVFGQHEVNPAGLYFDYFAYRRTLEQCRKQDLDFHNDLLGIAEYLKTNTTLFSNNSDLHEIELRVIGYGATLFAKNANVLPGQTAAMQRVAAVNILNAAEKASRSHRKLAKQLGNSAVRTMFDFAQAIPRIEPLMQSATQGAHRRAVVD